MLIKYLHFDALDSTNTWTKNHAHELSPEGLTCITAKEQTAGIGRFKRSWISPPGNLYATLFFTLPLHASYLPNIGQILALSCTTLLQEKGFPVEIKWPNDLLLHKKKIAGILTETVQLGDSLAIVLGIGLNLNLSEEALASINQPATSLTNFSKKNHTVEEILPCLLQSFLKNLTLIQQHSFTIFQQRFNNSLAYKGEEITLKVGPHPLIGICQGIAADGRLQLLLPNGEIRLLWSGNE